MASIPYGSVISVTTKSEMRYEGTLSSLDVEHAIVYLTDCKVLGTEGKPRKGGLPPVPGSATVFPLLEFKGGDIVDIKVLVLAASSSAPSVTSLQNSALPPPNSTSALPASSSSNSTSSSADTAATTTLPLLQQQRQQQNG